MDCIFCKIANGEIPSNKIYEDDLVMVIMDTNPTVDGHALVIPKKHYTDYLALDKDILDHILKVGNEVGTHITKKLNSKSLTFLVNYGDAQKVKHFHLHLLPDYGPDTVYKLKRTITENYELIMK
jgi:histidine triad (HIT) family protein